VPTRRLRAPGPLDLQLTVGRLRSGRRDPCLRLTAATAWWTTRAPTGPATLALRVERDDVSAEAWGPGADEVLERVPMLLGFDDDPAAFAPRHPLLRDLHRRRPGMRLGGTGAVVEALIPAIVHQKVTGIEAGRAYRRLVRQYAEPAPGPGDMVLPPDPARLAETPYWALHRCGIERRRAETITRVARHARRLEGATSLAPSDAAARLTATPGVGPWTAAEVAQVALGDRDAVSVGDYNLPHLVSWNLAGERRGSDERMLELLAPFAGQRARVVRLLELSGRMPPRRVAHAPLRSFASS
jgi:3-methyladenine DNA glycosylase/8-oxoguanine DNA glycosylase